MPQTRTLAQMRTSARQMADMEGSDFVSDDEATRLVNLGVQGLWAMLTQNGVDRYLARTEVATTSGTREYVLPDDFVSLRLVELLRSTGGEDGVPLQRYSLSEGHRSGDGVGALLGYDGAGLRYAVVMQGTDGSATRLRFDPDPGARFVRVWYVQRPAVLAADGDTFDGVAGWEEWAELWAAEQMLIKEESNPQALMMRRSDLTTRIMNMADRDMGSAPQPARVRGRRRNRRSARTG